MHRIRVARNHLEGGVARSCLQAASGVRCSCRACGYGLKRDDRCSHQRYVGTAPVRTISGHAADARLAQGQRGNHQNQSRCKLAHGTSKGRAIQGLLHCSWRASGSAWKGLPRISWDLPDFQPVSASSLSAEFMQFCKNLPTKCRKETRILAASGCWRLAAKASTSDPPGPTSGRPSCCFLFLIQECYAVPDFPD